MVMCISIIIIITDIIIIIIIFKLGLHLDTLNQSFSMYL